MAVSAVITADIVNSTSLGKGLEKKLKDSFESILKHYKYEYYRGDSFQAYIKEPRKAFIITLLIRMAARKLSTIHDVRTGIGIGQVNPLLKKLSTATSEAFIISGRALDGLTGKEARLNIKTPNQTVNLGMEVIANFTDYLLANLTERQSEVITELLSNKTQTETSLKLKKSQSTINKHARAGGWNEIQKLNASYEKLISSL